MTQPETKAVAGGDVSPAQEVKTAMAGFMSDLTTFQSDIQTKLQKQEERLTMLDRKSMTSGRPALATSVDTGAPHQKAFNAYLRSGDDDGLRGLELEGKAMSTAVAGDGGYLVDPQTADTIQSVLQSTASIRAIANVVNVEATSFDVLVDHSDVDSGWVNETGTVAEGATPTIDRISIPLYELSALPKASQRLLDDSAFDVETWLAGRIADKFARS
ncbi:MAG: phage major capsid protein, partial [Planktomarina sp.]